jgi:cytochrome c biogenesis protein CcmG, thiol:disulfide interchange protein DsbE
LRAVRLFLLVLLGAIATASVGAASSASPQAAPTWPLLNEYQGKVVLVDFWASWCGPCLQSFPWMNGLHARHANDGLVILAVNLDQERALADAFLKKVPAQFRVEYDQSGSLAKSFGVEAMPTSFLIGRDGKVRARHAGFRDKQREGREQEIVQLLKEPAK